MMSAFEDSQQQQQQQPQQQQPQQTQNQTPHTPLRLTDEAANYNNTSSSSSSSSVSDSGSKTSNNNNSIMGKVKLRVSSILPDSLSKWFSPSNTNLHNNATEQEPSSSLTHSESESQSQQSTAQHNGNAANLVTQCKLKRSRRRIQLEADDAGDNAVDDGTSAQDLNEEEVQLADNIAENDLAGEDEQTRRNEYNVSLLRKRQLIASEDDDDDDEDDEEEGEEEEEDELEDGAQQNNYQMQQANRISTAQPLQKRKRIEPNEITFSPLFNAQQRRLPPLHASTPAISEAVRSHQTSNRFSTHLNLYGNQRQREPAYDFMSTSTGGDSSSSTNIISEAAVATSGDLPMSSRRSLNIAPMTERRETALPSYKRQSLLGPRGLIPNWRSYQTISEDSPNEEQQQQQTNNNNNNNNNNNIKMTKRSTDSQSECESTESQAAAGRMHNINSSNNNNNNNSNGNALFYSNLQSRKSVFNRNSATSMLQQNQHHNSTLSLNSLNHRRRFNASIYGSTSALSDSRLLSTTSSHSIITGNSPFYQGPTAFGGSSANNRCFSQGNLPNIINSGGSSPAPSNSDSVCSNSNNQLGGRQQMIGGSYGIKPIDMRPRAGLSTISAINDRSSANVPGLSLTAQRILNLLENHRTPLMDAKKMGSTLREHKLQRSSRYLANTTSSSSSSSKPYAYPNHSIGGNNSSSSSNTSLLDMDSKSKLLVPTMLQLLERRRLTRVTSGTRSLVDAKQLEEQQLLHHRPQQPQQQQTANATPTSLNNNNNNNNNNNSSNTSFGLQSHTNKMRSRLSHQTRKDARNAEEQQLPPAPIDLPNIRFPKMASEPKFDLIIAPPSGLASAQQHKPFNSSNNNTSSNSNNNNGGRRRFLFPAPISVSCANPTEESAPLQKRAKNQASYKFSPPLTLDKSLESAAPKALQFNGETAINTTTTTTTTNSSSNDNAWPKSTATTTFGFGDQFKKSASEWECEACMLRNKQDLQKCVACETPKPKAKTLSATISAASTATTAMPATTLSFSGFGDRFKQPTSNWECNVCMLSNKDEHSKCIACETPRRNTSTASMSNIMGSNSNSFDSINNNNSIPSLPLNFDDVFKRPTNIWECPSCMIMNSDTVTECPACQTPNPKPMTKSNSSSSAANNKSTNSSSFKFGFGSCTAGNVEQPRPDAGFQQLIAAQKASSWNCEACMAQNDMNRNKCICCEQLKPGASAEEVGTAAVPKFMFGFPAKSTTETAAATSANATTTNTTSTASATSFAPIAASAAPFTPFTFGFAAATAGKDVADSNKPPATAALTTTTTTAAAAAATTTKAATTTTTATNTAATTTASATTSTTGLNTFKFGTETATNKTAGFTFGATAAAPQQQQLPLKTSNASTAATSSSSSSSNLLGGLFTTPTAPKTTSTATTLASIGFTFGSNSNTAATTTTAAATKPAVSNLFTLAGFAPPSAVVSSSSNIITTPNNSSTNTSTSSFKPSTTPMFNFGSNIVSSSSSSVTSPAAAGAKTTSALFGAQTPTVVATSTVASTTSFTAAPAIVASTTSFTTGPAMPTFVFGNTTAANSPATTVSSSTNVSSNNTKNFIFGSPTATTSTTTTATFAPPATGSSIFGSIASVQSNNSSSFNAPTSSNSTPLFTFGSASNMNANANNNNNNNNSNSNIGSSTFGHTPTFNFGGPKPEATTTATAVTTTSTTPTLSSFGWPTATTSNAATPFGSATPFANSPATSAGATAPLHIFGSSGNGTSSNLFGSNTATRTTNSMQPLAVSSPFGAATAATTGGTAVVHPTAGNGPISTLFGNVNSPFSSNAAGAANSGGGSSITSPLTNIFSAKPTTNIAPGAGAAAATTGATAPKMAFNFAPATTPAGGVFNFGSNVASNPGGNNALPKPAFNFTEVAPQTSAFNFSANSANASNAGNRDSTPSAAPFQFNAGSPASANIFAFNPPPNTGGAMQNPRRKIRAPVRRLPPR